ncbi:DUF397 domain-containing protein [Micromonospora craniellae]|uniref:DUF397 domain-containing protein n=1 Tax=Micromonospora craniellae TaxID=2294034 RepID=A0A372FUP7_9ACTN|nr:DUF397 domain-containing protein [Micromonospora craniellae]QOC89807.1 DUF397 domain-containing protein [Micromonospora craniellae]RFS44475.1 DUF397 domain-containing protein [Micromonospora craniellae]
MTAQPFAVDRDWFKSSRSSDNANCVEVRLAGGGVGVRDSKDRGGPVLAFGDGAWSAFLHALKADAAPPA